MIPLRSGARGIRLGLAGALALAGALVWTPVSPAAAAPSHVAIVIAGQGASCVTWHAGITGDEVLNDVASVRYRNDGLIVQIDGVPSSGKADDTHFWSYWHNTGGGWRYSSSGASGYQPAAGTVEGWSFDNGGSSAPQPPSASYAAICSDASAPAHASSPRPSHAPVSRSRPRSAGGVTAPHRSGTTPATAANRSATTGAARSSAASSAARARSSSAAASGSSSAAASTAPDASGASSARLRPLTKLAAHHSSGSPLPLILTGMVVVLLGGGAAVVALRRRTGRP